MSEMLTPTARICLHADVDGDPTRCPCILPLPPGMEVDDDWQLWHGHVLRVLDGSLHNATDFNGADARRMGQALLKAAEKLDSLLSARSTPPPCRRYVSAA